ncbi:MAG: MFS transporter [Bacteroidales bacterium]|nr:MFS transporter [Bacteroidales bacterium]
MDDQTRKKYNYWQWRTLIILMVGYLLFYFVRKNFSLVMPALESELGLSKIQLGIFLTINGIVYGLSRFVNGFLADRFSRKALMATGLALSAVVNILIGLSPQLDGLLPLLDTEGKATVGFVWFVGALLIVNGYMQGMGYPPCASLMANWFKPSELATKQSIWNSSHSIGAGLVALLCGFILQRFTYSAWQWCFFVPAILSVFGAALIFFGLADTPESVGLPAPDGQAASRTTGGKDSYKKFIREMVFRNPVIWILAATNFCVYVIRFTILDWGTTFMTQYKGMDIAAASSVVAASELFGGIVGTLAAGWVTDKFFASKAHRVCLICTLGATLSFFLFWKTPDSMNWLSIVFIVLSSFFVYGPQALLGIAASNQATKHAAATANGVLGIFGYVSPLVSALLFGFLADRFGWDSVFAVAIGFGLLGSLIIASIWKAPADGYDRAARLD